MTMISRETFEDIMNFDELIDLCDEVRCDICEEVISKREVDEIVLDYIMSTDWNSWEGIQRFLDDELTIYESETGYYVDNGDFEYSELYYYDFENYKEDVERFLVDKGYLPPYDEEPEDEVEEDDDEEDVESGAALEEMLMGGM